MNLGWITAISVALGADAFSLALAIGLAGISKARVLQLSLVVAVFHIFMPLVGLAAGQALGLFLGQIAKAVGASVLVWLGMRMLVGVLRPGPESYPLSQARKKLWGRGKLPNWASLHGVGIYALAASVSLDALSVGFSLGALGSNIGGTVLLMGGIAGLMTLTGLVLGRLFGSWAGERAELLGGLALVLIGFKIFF